MYAAHIGKMNKVTLVVVSRYNVAPRGIGGVEKTLSTTLCGDYFTQF